jgi:hypothetical protein
VSTPPPSPGSTRPTEPPDTDTPTALIELTAPLARAVSHLVPEMTLGVRGVAAFVARRAPARPTWLRGGRSFAAALI